MTSWWRLFCENSSIRGVQKILKAHSGFTKALWTTFVVVMTLVLLTVSAFLVRDFLEYGTAWHTSTAFDEKPEFPSFTLCSHNPFSFSAQSAWLRGSVMSPLQFQSRLKDVTAEAVRRNITELTSIFAYDNIETYYQQLEFNDTIRLGHGSDSLFFCVVLANGEQYIAENCKFGHMLNVTVRLYSQSEFFNCFTIDSDNSNSFESFIIVMSLVPAEDLPTLKHSFLYDVLTRGEGVKVTIHEKSTIPDFAQSGFNVEPGRMNEVNYDTTRWLKLRTPKNECKDNQAKIRHLNSNFVSSYHQCVNAELQRYLLRACGCQSSLWPVIRMPDASAPYCIDVSHASSLEAIHKRITCTMTVVYSLEEIRKNVSSACLPRCSYYTYQSTLSITKWIPSPNKLAALVDQQKTANRFFDSAITGQQLVHSISKNISSYTSSNYSRRFSRQNTYTYVKLKRKNWDTNWKVEKLTLDINILLSRIGGLCSLCIGLTAAFIAEVVEFVYLSLRSDDSSKRKRNRREQPEQIQESDQWDKADCSMPLRDASS